MQWIGEKQKQVLVGLLPSGRLGAGVECPGAEKGKLHTLLQEGAEIGQESQTI